MTSDERNRQMDATRVRAELTVQDLWLRYVGLGGTGDAFDVDGYLQGLVPLETFQQDVLAQALNEALRDRFQADTLPLSQPGEAHDERLAGLLAKLVDEIIADRWPARQPGSGPRGEELP